MIPAARPIPIFDTTNDVAVASGLTLITGWSFAEITGAAPAIFALYDGSSNSGALIAYITLNAGESTRDLIPEPFLACMSGLYLSMINGEIEGSIWAIEATLVDGLAFAQGARPFWTGEL
jgi:hypothetical protein